MPFMAGKQAFLELLKQEGVDLLFGNPGTTELPLMDGLAREKGIRYILTLQEGVAIAMADGYAQASGRLAAVNVHISPGLGNAMGMLYDAQKAGSPLLLTAGQHDQSFTATEPILWSDLPPVAKPYVKWATEIRRLEDLPRLVHRAAKVALTPPTGPVFLSLPVDVLNAERDLELGEATRVDARLRGSPEAVERAADLLAAATHPVPPLTLIHAVASSLPADAVVVEEAISSGEGLRELLRCQDPHGFFGLRGGGIGWGLPAALGVKLALPHRPVVALVGDGSAMYTVQALWTAAREGLAVVVIILNNRSYRILKQRTYALKGFSAEDDVYVGMDLDRPPIDFVGLARALGAPGERVARAAEIAPALARGLAAGGPYLLDVDADAGFKRYPARPDEGGGGLLMTCSQCGSHIPEGARSCPNCRAPVRPPGLLERFFGWLGSPRKAPAPRVIRRTEVRQQRFEIVDAAGKRQVYQFLDEVPPEFRSTIEEAIRAGVQGVEPGKSLRITVKDASGREHTYNSLEEMLPDIRAIYEQYQQKDHRA